MKILFYGISGAMGKIFRECAENAPDMEIVCGIDKDPEACDFGFPVYGSCKNIIEKPECIIDFSMHACVYDYLPYAIQNGIPCVIASTGFNEEEKAYIRENAKKIPILQSGNMSLGVNVLLQIAKFCAKSLKNVADIEIVEQHHRRKADAPSGTALLLADGIKSELKDSTYVLGRSGLGKRTQNEIGISAVRGGTIVGKHEVIFALDGEVITLKHEAESRQIFALGSMNAARFLVGKPAGLYSMEDLFSE